MFHFSWLFITSFKIFLLIQFFKSNFSANFSVLIYFSEFFHNNFVEFFYKTLKNIIINTIKLFSYKFSKFNFY